MRYLVDANLSPDVVQALIAAGYDATHVGDHGLLVATDDEIFDWAAANEAVVVTADSDFAMLLATRRAQTPSVILLRDVADRPRAAHAELLIDNLAASGGCLLRTHCAGTGGAVRPRRRSGPSGW